MKFDTNSVFLSKFEKKEAYKWRHPHFEGFKNNSNQFIFEFSFWDEKIKK